MNKKQFRDAGFAHVVLILVIIIVVGVIGLAGYMVTKGKKTNTGDTSNANTIDTRSSNNTNTNTNSGVMWSYVNDKWSASSTPPKCHSPLLDVSPVDVTQATSILYPGQTRGIYKPHGGFRLDNNKTNVVDIKLSLDAKVIRASRYIQTGQVQYMLDFENECGVAMRYDHLRTLAPKFQAIVDKLPEPKVNDSTTTDIRDGTKYKAGEVIATQVGFIDPLQNTTFDYGVYDYRQPNNASKDPTYASAHKNSNASDYYAICWLNDLPAKDSAIVKQLPGGDGKAGKSSDYCK